MFWFGCSQQQKRHAAALPPAGMQRRMERRKQKTGGSGLGVFNRTANKGNRNNNDTEKEKTRQNRPHNRLSRTAPPLCPPKPRVSSCRAASLLLEPCLMAHGMEYPALFGQVGVGSARPGCAPSWIPVKINPVLVKPRTISVFIRIYNH